MHVKHRPVGAGRDTDRHEIGRALGAIGRVQLRSEPASFNTHDGILTRIETHTAIEDVNTERVFLQGIVMAVERIPNDTLEEAA